LDHFEFNFYKSGYWNDGFTVPCHCWFLRPVYSKYLLRFNSQEDWVMWLLIFQQKPKIFLSTKPLALYRVLLGEPMQKDFDETLLTIRYLKPFKG
jgi:hypothetical protein